MEIPIKIRLDHGPDLWADLRLIKRRAKFGNAENVSNARIFYRVVAIGLAGIFKPAPGNDTGHAWISPGPIMSLRMIQRLVGLQLQVTRAAINIFESLARIAVGKLPDAFRKHIRHARQRSTNADAAVGGGMIIVQGKNILIPALGGMHRHGTGSGT